MTDIPPLPPNADPIEFRDWTQRIQQAYLKRVPASTAVPAAPTARVPQLTPSEDPLDVPAVHRVRQLLLHHRTLATAFLHLLASPSPPATYMPPSSLLNELCVTQAQLNAAVVDLQTHLSLCSLSHTTLLTSFAYANKISTLLRSLHSCEQSLQLALDPAPDHLVQLDSIVAQQLDPARVLDYAFKVAGQTAAPPVPEGAPEPKPTFAPDEASMQFGVLFKLAEGVLKPASLRAPQPLAAASVAAGGAEGEPADAETQVTNAEVAEKASQQEAKPSAPASSYGILEDENDGMESVLDEDGALNFDF